MRPTPSQLQNPSPQLAMGNPRSPYPFILLILLALMLFLGYRYQALGMQNTFVSSTEALESDIVVIKSCIYPKDQDPKRHYIIFVIHIIRSYLSSDG